MMKIYNLPLISAMLTTIACSDSTFSPGDEAPSPLKFLANLTTKTYPSCEALLGVAEMNEERAMLIT